MHIPFCFDDVNASFGVLLQYVIMTRRDIAQREEAAPFTRKSKDVLPAFRVVNPPRCSGVRTGSAGRVGGLVEVRICLWVCVVSVPHTTHTHTFTQILGVGVGAARHVDEPSFTDSRTRLPPMGYGKPPQPF